MSSPRWVDLSVVRAYYSNIHLNKITLKSLVNFYLFIDTLVDAVDSGRWAFIPGNVKRGVSMMASEPTEF